MNPPNNPYDPPSQQKADCPAVAGSPSSETPETDANEYGGSTFKNAPDTVRLVHADLARKLERERNSVTAEAGRSLAELMDERDEAHALLRRIARKGEFMDREGLRLVVADWLARRHLSENETSPSVDAKEKANDTT